MIDSLRRHYYLFILSGLGQFALLLITTETRSRFGWVLCVGLIAIISLIGWTFSLHRRRIIADTPTSRIGTAAQGYVELNATGKPLDSPPLYSHHAGLPCLWYRYKVEEKSNDNKWETTCDEKSDVSFILEDDSGRCVVDVEGAEILTRHKESWSHDGRRFTEWTLQLNDPIYALGEFRTLGGGTIELDTKADINALLSEWKKDKATLLKRFDLNGDGDIDMKEWMLARQAARREVEKEHVEIRNEGDVNTLSRPQNGQLYLLSNLDPNKIARRYLWWAGFQLIVFFGALAAMAHLWRITS